MLHLVKGKEEFLRKRAVQDVISATKKTQPDLQILTEDASAYRKGQLAEKLTPTLFGDVPAVIYDNAHNCTDDFIEDILELVKKMTSSATNLGDQVTVIISHSGAVRGKKMLTAIEKANHPAVKVALLPELKRDLDKAQFVMAEFRRFNKQVTIETSNAVVQFAGQDLSEMVAYIDQIAHDVPLETVTIPKEYVNNFFNSLIQVSTWDIVDAALAGDAYRALALFRQALVRGESPNSIIPGISYRLKQLAKASAVQAGELTAQEARIQPWQMTNFAKELQRMTSAKLAKSFQELANADVAAKGGAKDGGVYALEIAIETLAG